jgi:hypothetical protein
VRLVVCNFSCHLLSLIDIKTYCSNGLVITITRRRLALVGFMHLLLLLVLMNVVTPLFHYEGQMFYSNCKHSVPYLLNSWYCSATSEQHNEALWLYGGGWFSIRE